MKKFYFNMIEIILAISIISIGISSVMVLFTSGIKSSNATVDSSKVSDVADTVIADVRARASGHYDTTGWKSQFDTEFPALNSDGWNNSDGEVLDSKKISDFTFKPAGEPDKDSRVLISDGNGNYLYRQLRCTFFDSSNPANNQYETVFSAIAQVRQVSAPENEYKFSSDIKVSNPLDPGAKPLEEEVVKGLCDIRDSEAASTNVFKKTRRIVEIRISYPADLAPELRDEKIYRIELYNDKYDGF